MRLSRRNFLSMASAVTLGQLFQGEMWQSGALTAVTTKSAHGGPILWSTQHNGAVTYIFGFGDAKTRSWFTPKIQNTFNQSKEVWFEIPKNVTSDQDKAEDSQLEQELGHDDKRSLFDVLGPATGGRTLKLAQELGVRREEIEHLRPWLAYFTINQAFFRHSKIEVADFADQVLAAKAAAAGKTIHSEYPKPQDVTRWFGALSDEAQREHMEDLLDYIDDEKSGRNQQNLGWIDGHPDMRFIDRIRLRRPAMYKEFQADRNRQWADRIAGFTAAGGPYFVVIGLNHVLGPDSLLRCLERIGIAVQRV